MNTSPVLILGILLDRYALGTLAEVLDIRHLKPTVPEEFRKSIDQDTYQKWRFYSREKSRFQFSGTPFRPGG